MVYGLSILGLTGKVTNTGTYINIITWKCIKTVIFLDDVKLKLTFISAAFGCVKNELESDNTSLALIENEIDIHSK